MDVTRLPMRMTEKQKLRSESVYRLNYILHEIRDALPKFVELQPVLFNTHNRRFYPLAVHPQNWDPANFWNYFKKDPSWSAKLAKWGEYFDWGIIRIPQNPNDEHGYADLHRHLLDLYVKQSIEPNRYADGIIYKLFKQEQQPFEEHVFELLLDPAIPYGLPLLRDEKGYWDQASAERVDPLLTRNHKFKEDPFLGVLSLWMRLGSEQPRWTYVLPIYEMAGENVLWPLGSVHALVYERDSTKVSNAIEDVKNALAHRKTEIAAAFRRGAFVELTSLDLIGSEGFLQLFIQNIARLQDWERAWLLNGDQDLMWIRSVGGEWYSTSQIEERDYSYFFAWNSEYLEAAGIGDLTEEERSMFGNFEVRFKLPPYSRLQPGDELTVRRHVWTQQADLLKLLFYRWRAVRASTRMAAVTIATRNLSHNIGSHVLSRLSQPQVLKDIATSTHKLALSRALPGAQNVPHPYIDLARFNGYLRDRMDFLADLATTLPAWTQNAFLDQLVKDFDDQSVLKEWLIALSDRGPNEHRRAAIRTLLDSDLPVALPHGVLGAHALYVIFENALRNSARHGEEVPTIGPLELELILVEKLHDCLHLALLDPASPIENPENPPIWLLEIRRYLNEPLVSSGTINRQGWGVKEMKIAAAFLRLQSITSDGDGRSSFETIGYPSTRGKPFLEARHAESSDGRTVLAWHFLLLKPKLALVEGFAVNGKWSTFGVDIVKDSALGGAKSIYPFLLTKRRGTSNTERLGGGSQKWKPYRCVTLDEPQSSHSIENFEDIARLLAESPSDIAASLLSDFLWNRWIQKLTLNAGLKNPPKVLIKDGSGDLNLERDERECILYVRHPDDRRATNEELRNLIFMEGYTGESTIYRMLETLKYGGGRASHSGFLAESGLVAVVILDERLSVWSKRRSPEEELSRRSLRSDAPQASRRLSQLSQEFSGVFIIPFENEDQVKQEEIAPRAIWRYVAERWMHTPGMVFVTIHQNLIQRFESISKGRWKLEEWIDELRSCPENPLISNRDFIFATVHSGRGATKGFHDHSRLPFLEYANLERWVRDQPSKHNLCHVLFGAR